MPTKQGGLELLQTPVAQELLQSNIPARLAYVWRDGTPRVIPIWFHWNGEEIVLGTMVRIAVKPEWVAILDFEQRFPSAIEAAMSGR